MADGTCADAYVVCDGTVSAAAPTAVPRGTMCINGTLVLATDSACAGTIYHSSATEATTYNVTVLARGLASYAGPRQLGAIVTAIASILSAADSSATAIVTVAPANADGPQFATAEALVSSSSSLSPPLPGIEIVAADGVADGPGIGVMSAVISIAMSAPSGKVSAQQSALFAAVSLNAVTGLSPVTVALAADGSQVTIEPIDGAVVITVTPSETPLAESSTNINKLSLAAIVCIAIAIAFVLAAAITVRVVMTRRKAERVRRAVALKVATAMAAAATMSPSGVQNTASAAVAVDGYVPSSSGTVNGDLKADVEAAPRNKTIFIPVLARPVDDAAKSTGAVAIDLMMAEQQQCEMTSSAVRERATTYTDSVLI